MFKYVSDIYKNNYIALIAAILYITAPYKLTDIYIRFALGEFTAFVFIPILLLGLYNLFYENEEKSYYITIGAVGLMLTHTITLYYMFIFSIIFILLNIKKLKNIQILKKICINAIFTITISVFFLTPLIECKNFGDYSIFNNDIMKTNAEWVKENTLPISEILFNNSKTEEDANVLFKIGTPSLVFIVIGIFVFRKIDTRYKKYYILNLIFSILCLFMASSFFPWNKLPDLLCQIQYPWRMIGFSSVFLSIVCSINFCTFLKICTSNKQNAKLIFTIIIISIITVSGIVDISPYLTEMKDKGNDIEYENYILNNLSIGPMQINREYLPTKALMNLDYISNRDEKVKLISGNANIQNIVKDKLKYSFDFYEAEKSTTIELPYLYYPYYSIKVNGKNVEMLESDNGLITINIENNGTVTLDYSLTTYLKISYMISFISLILFIIYVITRKRKMQLLLSEK